MRHLLLALALGSAWFHNGKLATPATKQGTPPDTTPPETTLSGYPDNPTTDRTATFTFASDDPAATFTCNLDGGGYSSCTSPKVYSGPLAYGSHTFLVRATDAANNTDSSPASHTWVINLLNEKSMSHDGSDDVVSIGKPSDMNLTPGVSNFTIALWVKRGEAGDFERHFVSKATMDGGSGGTVGVVGGLRADNAIEALAYGGENTFGGDAGGSAFGWHYYGLTLAGPTGLLYLDGHQVGSSFAVGSTPWNTTASWLIGGSRGSTDTSTEVWYPWKGKTDEVTFWSRALTAAEHLELFNNGDPYAPTTHSRAANLIHWYRMGDGDTYPTILDQVGGATGTCQNMAGAGNITTDVPVGLDVLPCVAASGCEQLVSDDWDGSSSTWTARVGSNNATKRGTPTLDYSPNFMGRKATTISASGACMTMTGDALTNTTTRSYEVLMDDWGTATGKYLFARTDGSFVNLANWFYKNSETAFESAIYTSGAGGIWLGAAGQTFTNTASKAVAITITMDLSAPRLTVYRNGTQIYQDTSTSGSFGTATNLAVGIGCRWNQSSVSTEVFGGRYLEFLRHGVELPSGTVASRLSQFNNLKGY